MEDTLKISILKRLIDSCRTLSEFQNNLYDMGIDVGNSAVVYAMDNLTECACEILDVGVSDMRGDKIIKDMMDSKLTNEEILNKILSVVGLL